MESSQIRPTSMMQAAHNPILAVDDKGVITYCNLACEKVMHRPVDELIGRHIDQVLQQSHLPRVAKSGIKEPTQTIEIEGITYLSNRSPIIIDGKVVGAVAILQDISELEAISSELKSTRLIAEELDAIFNSSFDGIYVTDGTGVTIRVNSAYERITGIRKEEVLGKNMRDLVKEGFFNESVTLKALKSGQTESLMQKVKTGKTLMVTGTPIRDEKGQIILVVTNVRDVTELSHLQNKLEAVNRSYSEREIELKQLKASIGKDSKHIFISKKMAELKQFAIRLAQVDSTVLIQGESGVGKEVLADLIHENSNRSAQPFIKISCAAIPENLLESELFGYVSGAFTGASKEGKIGIFEACHGGTVFLDEIGELTLALQAKFLRVLQEQQIFRIGDTTPIKIDVRIIAATNRNLEEMMIAKEFRSDLFFRLNVVPVKIPPLRERKEAIIHFIYHFVEKCNHKYGFSRQVSQEVCDRLIAYKWPGNVRELENVIERIIVTTPGDVIHVENLPSRIRDTASDPHLLQMEKQSLREAVAFIEHCMISEAIEKNGTTRKAARILGVDQSTIVRKAKRYGIELPGK